MAVGSRGMGKRSMMLDPKHGKDNKKHQKLSKLRPTSKICFI